MVVLGAAAQAGRAGVGWARVSEMQFARRLREQVRRGRIRCTVRVWTHLHVKVGGRYPMEEGHVVVDSVEAISEQDVTHDLARDPASTTSTTSCGRHATDAANSCT